MLGTLAIAAVAVSARACEVYTGSAGPVSSKFSVELSCQGKALLRPHVYGIKTPDTRKRWKDRTDSFVELQLAEGEEAIISVTRMGSNSKFPEGTEVRPTSSGIKTALKDSGKTAVFKVTGSSKTLSLHYGEYDPAHANDCAEENAMLFFVTPALAPMPSPASELKIPAGEHYILSDGTLWTKPDGFTGDLPKTAGTGVINVTRKAGWDGVWMQRGAYVYGKLRLAAKKHKGVQKYTAQPAVEPAMWVRGPGVLDGSYFDYNQRKTGPWSEQQPMLGMQQSPDGTWMDSTIIVHPNFRLFDAVVNLGSVYRFRGLGFQPNNGMGHFSGNNIAKHIFVRSFDDLIKIRASNVTVLDSVLWQGYNGGTFQLGWGAFELSDMTFSNIDVIGNEHRAPTEWDGAGTRANNAIFSCVNPSGMKVQRLTYENITVDGDARNLLVWGLNSDGFIRDITIRNLLVRGKIVHFNGMSTKHDSAQISAIHFDNFSINGHPVTSINDADFKFHTAGNVDASTFTFARRSVSNTVIV